MIDDWIQSLPGVETRLQTAIRDAREVIADLDDTPWPKMDHMFHMQAYDVLHMHLEEILAAFEENPGGHTHANGTDGSARPYDRNQPEVSDSNGAGQACARTANEEVRWQKPTSLDGNRDSMGNVVR